MWRADEDLSSVENVNFGIKSRICMEVSIQKELMTIWGHKRSTRGAKLFKPKDKKYVKKQISILELEMPKKYFA